MRLWSDRVPAQWRSQELQAGLQGSLSHPLLLRITSHPRIPSTACRCDSSLSSSPLPEGSPRTNYILYFLTALQIFKTTFLGSASIIYHMTSFPLFLSYLLPSESARTGVVPFEGSASRWAQNSLTPQRVLLFVLSKNTWAFLQLPRKWLRWSWRKLDSQGPRALRLTHTRTPSTSPVSVFTSITGFLVENLQLKRIWGQPVRIFNSWFQSVEILGCLILSSSTCLSRPSPYLKSWCLIRLVQGKGAGLGTLQSLPPTDSVPLTTTLWWRLTEQGLSPHQLHVHPVFRELPFHSAFPPGFTPRTSASTIKSESLEVASEHRYFLEAPQGILRCHPGWRIPTVTLKLALALYYLELSWEATLSLSYSSVKRRW